MQGMPQWGSTGVEREAGEVGQRAGDGRGGRAGENGTIGKEEEGAKGQGDRAMRERWVGLQLDESYRKIRGR